MFSASPVTLNKKEGGIKPIAIGSTVWRLVSEVVCREVADVFGHKFCYLDFKTIRSCEAVVHAARSFFVIFLKIAVFFKLTIVTFLIFLNAIVFRTG